MNMTKIAFALCCGSLMLATTACGGKSKALMAVEDYEKTACSCKDAACVSEASKKFSEKSGDMATASSGEAEAIANATKNATTCVTKISTMAPPGAPGMK